MLIQLTIINFAIVRELKIHFQNGMTTITGETGAGKSIAIDALGLCLGERADASVVRMHTHRADICAHFSLHDAANAQTWLAKNHLDNNNECLLRRVITNDGRSRGFINGIPVPLSQLRELGQLLIQIHGQHAHQLLLKPEYQRHLLDTYGNLSTQLTQMRQAYQQWHHSGHLLTEYQQQLTQREARRQLLEYQLTELNDFAPQPGEYESIDEEYRRQANSEKLLTLSQQALEIISDTEQHNLLSLLHSVKKNITEIAHYDPHFASLLAMLEEASIQVSEVKTELQRYHKKIETDPGYLNQLEQRLSRQIALARKHHVAPEKLVELHQQLLAEQAILNQQESEQQQLAEDQQRFYQQTIHIAQQLHQQRVNIATELSEQITHRMRQLSMPHGHLAIEVTFTPETLTTEGADKIAFNVTTNPGQPLQPLTKVASGGELSRIALAIQVITAQKMDTPALIFDEIDVGISGPTAALVGRLLRQLGESTQVMCVTHLPQVAGCGHQHFYVSKQSDDKGTETHMQILDKKARLHELARLLGGSSVTRNTLANAKELLTT